MARIVAILICLSLNRLCLRKVPIILLLWEFFTPSLADDFSLEFEWQQVFSSLQDSS